MMGEPKIAGKMPVVLELEPGTYYWCKCGLSKDQPKCDGSHADSEFLPVEFTIEEKKNYALCLCKRTGNDPFCDGTHTKLEENE
jgi:CDGSH-type Zn-finger protein